MIRILALVCVFSTIAAAQDTLHVTKVRLHPRAGHADKTTDGRITGSNTSATNDFVTLVKIEKSVEGWNEIEVKDAPVYRFIKFESPNGGWGNVAEIEFYSGARKLGGSVFGTQGSRDNKGNDFARALDGDVNTFFEGASPNSQYVGIDLGEASQTPAPTFSLKSGAYEQKQKLEISCPDRTAIIRYTTNGQLPTRERGTVHRQIATTQDKRSVVWIDVDKPMIVIAAASMPGLADSTVTIAAYRIGEKPADAKSVTTFHIGNSLTDTVDGWLEPVARSAGRDHKFHRFTIPGAPTDWLWNHPGSGFGDSRYEQAFIVLAPIDHLFTQPFAGHNRSIENESEHSGKFYDLCRKSSPDVQHWLYIQWPGKTFKDSWAKGEGAVKHLNLKPATTWEEAVANHIAYTEALRRKMDDDHEGKPILIVPGGQALARLKTEIDAGTIPGVKDFFAEHFSDDIHLSPKGRYLIALVHYACIYKHSPEGKVTAAKTDLTDEQARVYQRIAWETVRDYKWAGVAK